MQWSLVLSSVGYIQCNSWAYRKPSYVYICVCDTGLYLVVENFRGRKFSQISQFCGYTRKFSLQNLGRGVLWHCKASNPRKFSPRKLYFHQFVKVFPLESFPLYGSFIPRLSPLVKEKLLFRTATNQQKAGRGRAMRLTELGTSSCRH